ncbi:class I SAM-dependent methyltransferase [Rhodoligotrophos appendicifer]|nr:class I SAM-dependent methyltransferase [Rhodoligotrophos appendicifer]
MSARCWPRDPVLFNLELKVHHRARERRFLFKYIPPGSVGAELGVFSGLFSVQLARLPKIAKITFVDPWWKAFGDHYPDWGAYTAHGRLTTRAAYDAARRRIDRVDLPGRDIAIGHSQDWLASLTDESLDWVYLDSSHAYEETSRELALLARKIRSRGIVLGDDWHPDPNHVHHGVAQAVHEAVRSGDFEIIMCGQKKQWALRRCD